MKIFEILNFNRELLIRLHDYGVRMEDTRYIDLYQEYSRMLSDGEKVSYIVISLADKYKVSERKVYSLIKRFQMDCMSPAVI